MNQLPTIVIVSAVAWRGTTARSQHFARGLAERGWNVLFVGGPTTILSPLKNRALASQLLPKEPIEDVFNSKTGGTLRVLTPVAHLPFGNMRRSINRLNQRLLAAQIRAAMPGPYILLPMLPTSIDLILPLRPMAVLYDCVDLHSEFVGLIDRDVVNQMEQELVYQSRAVFVTADGLKERMENFHSDVRLVPNAAQIEHFRGTQTSTIHPLLEGIPEPRIGYIGGIGTWVDQELIEALAKARPNVHFVMVGPVETDVTQLNKLQNVHFLGLQPYAELPQFLAGFQLTLHAFVRNELTESVNPVKIYEYLAAEKEVLSTASRELDKLSEVIWVTRDTDQALDALDRILAGETRTTADHRQSFVQAHSWDARVDIVEEALQSILPPHLSSTVQA
jgi:glycosyltransferase involved in cell wall biosynthesis